MPDVKAKPDGYHNLTPYLAVEGAKAAIDFYTEVFGAKTRMAMEAPGGGIAHAELEIGDSVLMLADEAPDLGFLSPPARGGTAVTLMLYVDDVDATVAKAIAAGAKELRPVEDQFYGDRSGQVEDPFGHRWNIATHIEDVSDEEAARRAQELYGG